MAVGVSDPEAVYERLDTAEKAGFSDSLVKPLVSDLHCVNPSTYWLDFLISATLGWSGLLAALLLPAFSAGMFAAITLGAIGFYRALCFVHELSHQANRALPHFETAYNLLVGYPMLMPSFVYVGVHQSHHKVSVYGTDKDPEYLPFAQNSVMTIMFALESFLIPVVLLIRFVVLSPVGFVFPKFHVWLVKYLSSLTMNVKYRRDTTQELVARVWRESIPMFLAWAIYLGCMAAGLANLRFLLTWLAISSLVSFVNTLRTLGAHAYESDGQPMDRTAQLRDSIDTPGAFWTELWAPVGLRYHALHHYFPGIPYHSLPEAYRRIVNNLSVSEGYRQMSSPSLPTSLRKLIQSGLRKRS